jgi:WD40 repeat protein
MLALEKRRKQLDEAKEVLIADAKSCIASIPPLDYAASGSAKFTSEAFAWFVEEDSSSLPFSPRLLASASTNGTVCLWDPDTGGLITTLDIGDGEIEINAVAFSKDGGLLACGTDDGFIKLYDTNTMNHINDLEHHEEEGITFLAFSPTSDALVSSDWGGQVYVWDAGTGEAQRLGGSTGYDAIQALAFSKDGETLASGCNDGTITVWDMKTRTLVNHCTMDHEVENLAFYGKNGQVVVSQLGSVIFLDLSTWEKQSISIAPLRQVWSIASCPMDTFLAQGTDIGDIYVWPMDDPSGFHKLSGHAGGIRCLHASGVNEELVSSGEGEIFLWDTRKRTLVRSFEGQEGTILSVALSPGQSDINEVYTEVRGMLEAVEMTLSSTNGIDFTLQWTSE